MFLGGTRCHCKLSFFVRQFSQESKLFFRYPKIMAENVDPVVVESAMEPESKRAKIEEVVAEKSSRLTIPFVKLDENAKAPFYGSEFAAGADLHATEDCVIPVHAEKLVSTGLKLALPHGTYGRVAPRSGLAFNNQIDVGAGVVDEDYRGEVKVCLFNFGKTDFEVKQGDRIAQFVCQEISSSSTKEFPDIVKEVLEVRLEGENAKLPTEQGSGVVLYSSEDGSVAPGDMIALSTGVHVAIPTNYYGHVFILNELAIKNSLKVFAGVIDADYRGEIKILLFNHGKETFEVKTGEAVAIMTLEKVAACTYENVEELTETERGEGGFGSTGTSEIDNKPAVDESTKVFTAEKLTDDAQEPVYGTVLAAGADVFSAEEVTIPANSTALVSTGLKLTVQPGHYIRVAPRSGLAVKNFIDVGANVYFGNEELKVLLFNLGQEEFVVKKGDRIAQLVAERIAEIKIQQVQELSETKRGTGGFGSTGVSA